MANSPGSGGSSTNGGPTFTFGAGPQPKHQAPTVEGKGPVGGGSSNTPTTKPAPAPAKPKPKPTPGTRTPELTPAQQSAQADIAGNLDSLGLGSLASWAWGEYLNGVPVGQILLDLRQQPAYKAMYPNIDKMRQAGMGVTESDYTNYMNAGQGLMRAYGITDGFYSSREELSNLMLQNVSTSELQQRLDEGVKQVQLAPPDVKAALYRDWGVTDGDLTALVLDPKTALPLIEQNFARAQVQGGAASAGYGDLSISEADQLAGQTYQQAQQEFGTLVHDKQLFTPLTGTGETEIDRATQLAAAAGDQGAQDAIARRAEGRKAMFSSGGTPLSSTSGAAGAGTALPNE